MLAGTAASLALPSWPRSSRAQSSPAVSEAAWRELGSKITGGVIRPNDPRFVRLTLPENLRYYNPPPQPGNGPPDPDAPFGFVRPKNPAEVAYAIQWSIDNNLPMVPRSGGHSYAGCSTVPGLVISSDASAMQTVSVDEDRRVVAGGGALFGHLLAVLRDTKCEGGIGPSTIARGGCEFKPGSDTGRYTITHGRCAGVGLSAYLMGGGLALDSVFLGMGCDLVEKVEMVLADGSVVQASEKERPDLYWAVRGGGGGNLGFATKWWLRPIIVQQVTAFTGSWRLGSNAHSVFGTLLRALDAAPDTMGSQLILSSTAATIKSPWRYQITLSCEFHGSKADFDSILGAALAFADRAEARDCWFENCSSKDLVELPYWDAQEFFEIIGSPNRYQETSVFADEISDDFIGAIFGVWPSWPGTVLAARLSAYRLGGQVSKVPPGATAFAHRSAKWLVSTDIDWSGGDSAQTVATNLQWQRAVHNAFSDLLGKPGSYYNFPDPGLPNHARAYWGSNLDRLVAIKRLVDPNKMFNPPRNQGIVS